MCTTMNPTTPLPSIFDTQSLSGLKSDLKKDNPAAIKAAAQQFEAVFLQMMLKSMRAATPQDGMFESDQTKFYQELLDSQLSQVMAAQGGTGLSAMLERQLSGLQEGQVSPEMSSPYPLIPPSRAYPLAPGQRSLLLPGVAPAPVLPLDRSLVRPALPGASAPASAASATFASSASNDETAKNFAVAVWPHAVTASQATGIPPQFLLAHAALESGWGRSEPRAPDGRPSHNLFGIKAGSQWGGATVEAVTTEYVNGVAERRVERFRAYTSYAEAFEDYSRLLGQSPRYAAVLGSQDATQFAYGLQRAGYATDPAYGNKLVRVINSLEQKLVG